jgi:hypothetical protein
MQNTSRLQRPCPISRKRGWLVAVQFSVAAFAIVLSSAAEAQKSADSEGPDISGVWWASSYSPKIQPIGGGELPFTPAGRTAYEKNMAGLRNGSVEDAARTLCTPDGVPRLLETPYPFQIIQTRGQVTIVYEMNHAIRLVDMTKPVASDEELSILPYYDGHSAGRWEGNTLVIQTAGFKEQTFIDAYGAPHSDEMHVSERLQKINGGRQLEDVVTIEDPKNYTRPWSARFVYDAHPEVRLEAYVCGETHRNLSKVRGVRGF